MTIKFLTLHLLFFSLSAFAKTPALSSSASPPGKVDSISIEEYLTTNNLKAEISDKGLYYHIETYGQGEYPQSGDYVMVRYKGMLLNGQVFDESKDDEPFVFQLGYRQVILGWEYGIPLFQTGSKGMLYIPSELAYGETGVGKTIPPDTPLMFEIEVLEIMDFEAYDQYMVALEEKQRKAFEDKKKEQFKMDMKLIQEYAVSHKIKARRTASGLSYAVTKKGRGNKAMKGNRLKVAYKGYLTDDTLFDEGTYTVELGKGKVIPGWEEGLLHFKKGGEGWLLVPSQMAYGPRPIEEDDISIPANSVLAFKIKVLSIETK